MTNKRHTISEGGKAFVLVGLSSKYKIFWKELIAQLHLIRERSHGIWHF
jgi:hypothetical protein